MGGLIAQELAIRYPERVLSLVLGATWAGGPTLSRACGPCRSSCRGRTRKISSVRRRRSSRLRRSQPMIDSPRSRPCAARQASARRQMAAQMRYSSLRRLHTIQQPTLVMHGEKDRLISPLNARRMTRRIPGARLGSSRSRSHAATRSAPGVARPPARLPDGGGRPAAGPGRAPAQAPTGRRRGASTARSS